MRVIKNLSRIILMAGIVQTAIASPAVLVIDAQSDQQLRLLDNLDLSKSVVKLNLAKSLSSKLTEVYLADLAYRADFFKFIAGVEVNAQRPLQQEALRPLSHLAFKSTFFSTNLVLANSSGWKQVFDAESKNPHLILTAFGPQTMQQLQQVTSLAGNFAATNVPFVHVFATPQIKHATTFWQQVAKYHATSQQPAVYMLMAGQSVSPSYQDMIHVSLQQARQQIQWVGGDNNQRFTPIRLSEKQRTVWRMNDDKQIHGFLFQRDNIPAGLFAAMGMNQAAFNTLKQLIYRSQIAASTRVAVPADADHSLHTQQILSGLSSSCVCQRNDLRLPVVYDQAVPNQFTLLVDQPSDHAITKMFYNASVARSLQKAGSLGVFDYSESPNPAFYRGLQTAIKANPGFSLTYNAMNGEALKLLSSALKGSKVKHLVLGAETMRLLRSDAQAFHFLSSLLSDRQ